MALTIAVAQCNPVAGDLAGNTRLIVDAARKAHAQGAQLLLLPDGAFTGVSLRDLARRPVFVQACEHQLQTLRVELASLEGLVVVMTSLDPDTGGCAQEKGRSRILALCGGKMVAPCDGLPGGVCHVDVHGVRVGLFAENTSNNTSVNAVRDAGARLVVMLGGAPYRMGLVQVREQDLAAQAKRFNLPFIGVHLVGGHDERVYDGASFAVQASGVIAGRAPQFSQVLWMVRAQTADGSLNLHAPSTVAMGEPDGEVGRAPYAQPFNHAEVWQALVLGTRDYVHKSGFRDVILGLSGGMDSALVLALAVDALGRDHVRTVMMPTAYTAAMSLDDAHEMARRLGVRHDVIPIDSLCHAFEESLAPLFAGRGEDVTEENIQARVRGNLLMALSNKMGAMVLATGNKSELSTGYCTLYGDMVGGFAPLKDVLKTQVYALANWRNLHDPFGTGASPIPERIITRPPSAELRPDQTDQDSLPPYDVLDAIVAGYMENDASVQQLLDSGLFPDAVQQVVRLIRINEYKRQQAAPGVCISRRAYGCDWRYPLASRFVEGAGERQNPSAQPCT
ncbi:MAG: NAD+ synthase [Brachymonas sp.]|jgi:NAD+ synthase (glutamine-hydrolysing)|nr:NAD+ synthase [Brachymonas sp.]MBP9651490.1 NAD+ synthase [Brachymonas sp.]